MIIINSKNTPKFKDYPGNLRFLAEYINSYVDSHSKALLYEISSKINASIVSPQKGKRPATWRVSISKEHPLEFKKSSEGNFEVHVDLSCEMEGEVASLDSDKTVLKKYNVLIRIWSCQEKISYRERIDAPGLKQELEGQGWNRVVSRFHMDLRENVPRKPEPLYHLHFGGRSEDNEYCWIPKNLDEPRFCCFPMDLILLCEFILTNFFPEESENLRRTPEWRRMIQKSQYLYLRPYLARLTKFLNNENDTLLGHLSTCSQEGEFDG